MGYRATASALSVVLALAIAHGGTAADVAIDVERHAGSVVVDASVIVDADATTAWRVLTDYGRYREFVPGLRASRVIAREGAHVTVEQTGLAPWWLLRVPMAVTYDIVESAPASLRSRADIPGTGVLRSTYALTPAGSALRLRYTGTLTVAPGFLAPLREVAVEQAIGGHLRALAGEMARQARSHASNAMERPARNPGSRMADGARAGEPVRHR
ncbi:MAG TPA: SRPBCC family protein [Casimicrobiaceae bacterium]|nr:SRPBCC family protein [Casimicrobiaceae bacterium]